MAKAIAIALISIIIGLARFTVPGHGLSWQGSYEAVAHIWVGVLLTTIFCSRFDKKTRWLGGISLAIITALETVMFLLR